MTDIQEVVDGLDMDPVPTTASLCNSSQNPVILTQNHVPDNSSIEENESRCLTPISNPFSLNDLKTIFLLPGYEKPRSSSFGKTKPFDPSVHRITPLPKHPSVYKGKGFGKAGRPKKGAKKIFKPPKPEPLRRRIAKSHVKVDRVTRTCLSEVLSGKRNIAFVPSTVSPNPNGESSQQDYQDGQSSFESDPDEQTPHSPFESNTEEQAHHSPFESNTEEQILHLQLESCISSPTLTPEPPMTVNESESSKAKTIQLLQNQLKELQALVGNFRLNKYKTWQSYIRSIPKKSYEGPEFNYQAEWELFQPIYSETNQPVSRVNRNGFRPVSYLRTIMEFRPTLTQMNDFTKYISFMIWMGADIAGGAIIKAPHGYVPHKAGYEDWTKTFHNGHVQTVLDPKKQSAHFVTFKPEERTYSVQELFALDMLSPSPPLDETAKDFWEFMHLRKPVYCKDEIGTLFDEDELCFNLDKLDTLLKRHGDWLEEKDSGSKGILPGAGLIRSYLYLSCYGTLFSDHIEDFSFYSVNYLHFGHPKRWRFIPPSYGFKYIQTMRRLRAKLFKECNACDWFVLHKELMITDAECDANYIPYSHRDQYPGEFIITFPFSFHSGYNTGFNCAEAVNFATGPSYWPLYGLFTPRCGTGTAKKECPYGDVTKFDTGPLLEKCMPDVYQDWIGESGFKGNHPEALPFSPAVVARKGKVLSITDYICTDPTKESMDLSYRFRRFYKDEADLELAQIYNLEEEISEFRKQCSKKTGKVSSKSKSSKRKKTS